jgi:hypothetical protein
MARVSGRAAMRATSQRARQAAVAIVSAAAAPEVTMPACAPVTLAITRLAAACNCAISTDALAASVMACSTSASIRLPPRRVSVPAALMRRATPRRA